MITTSTNVLTTRTPKPPPAGAWDMITIHTNSGMRNPTGRPRRTGGMAFPGRVRRELAGRQLAGERAAGDVAAQDRLGGQIDGQLPQIAPGLGLVGGRRPLIELIQVQPPGRIRVSERGHHDLTVGV